MLSRHDGLFLRPSKPMLGAVIVVPPKRDHRSKRRAQPASAGASGPQTRDERSVDVRRIGARHAADPRLRLEDQSCQSASDDELVEIMRSSTVVNALCKTVPGRSSAAGSSHSNRSSPRSAASTSTSPVKHLLRPPSRGTSPRPGSPSNSASASNEFLRRILSIEVALIGSTSLSLDPQGALDTLEKYHKHYLPLIAEECRESLAQSLRRNSQQAYPVRQHSVAPFGPYTKLEIAFGRTPVPCSEGDMFILEFLGRGQLLACFALIFGGKTSGGTVSLKLYLPPNTPRTSCIAKALSAKSEMTLKPVCSVITSLRECEALDRISGNGMLPLLLGSAAGARDSPTIQVCTTTFGCLCLVHLARLVATRHCSRPHY